MNKYITEYLKISEILSSKLETLKNKNILITGATGLIGSYLTNYLLFLNKNNGYNINIYITARSKEKAEKLFQSGNIYIIQQDLNKEFNIKCKPDFIIHAAGNAHPLAFSQDPVGTMKTNLTGTINLLELAKECNSDFLYISTGEIYGNNKDKAFNEDDFGEIDSKCIRSCYPESKRAAETLCMAYFKQYGVCVNIARLCYIYGPTITDENSRADAQFLRNALNGESIVLKSEGTQKRTYCYVADAVSAILYILINNFKAEVFNIANPDSIASVREYAEILSKIANVDLKFQPPSETEKLGYSKQADSILDSSKLIKNEWKPLYSLEEGLRNTFLLKKRGNK